MSLREIQPGQGIVAFRLPIPMNGVAIMNDAVKRIYGSGDTRIQFGGDQITVLAPEKGFGPVKRQKREPVEDADGVLAYQLVKDGKLTVTIEEATEYVQRIGETTMAWFEAVGGINYVEMTLRTHDTEEEFVFTVQRKAGKTPDQLRREAEARIEELRSLAEGKTE